VGEGGADGSAPLVRQSETVCVRDMGLWPGGPTHQRQQRTRGAIEAGQATPHVGTIVNGWWRELGGPNERRRSGQCG
jgi:hypothetical protein